MMSNVNLVQMVAFVIITSWTPTVLAEIWHEDQTEFQTLQRVCKLNTASSLYKHRPSWINTNIGHIGFNANISHIGCNYKHRPSLTSKWLIMVKLVNWLLFKFICIHAQGYIVHCTLLENIIKMCLYELQKGESLTSFILSCSASIAN